MEKALYNVIILVFAEKQLLLYGNDHLVFLLLMASCFKKYNECASHLVFMFGLVRLDVALLMRQWWIMLGLKLV